jgi:hypothetical protein
MPHRKRKAHRWKPRRLFRAQDSVYTTVMTAINSHLLKSLAHLCVEYVIDMKMEALLLLHHRKLRPSVMIEHISSDMTYFEEVSTHENYCIDKPVHDLQCLGTYKLHYAGLPIPDNFDDRDVINYMPIRRGSGICHLDLRCRSGERIHMIARSPAWDKKTFEGEQKIITIPLSDTSPVDRESFVKLYPFTIVGRGLPSHKFTGSIKCWNWSPHCSLILEINLSFTP